MSFFPRSKFSADEAAPGPIKADAANIPKLTVETIDNHIYFYSEVDSDRCLALIRTIRELDSRLRSEYLSRMLLPEHLPIPIWLHIESPGGGLFTAFNIASQLQQIETPIYSIVEGYAASAATILSCACTRRFILPNSFMLIHQLSSIAWGTYEQLKDDMHLYDMSMNNLREFYASCTKFSRKKVEKLLQHDSWFNAPECLENGLVDEIMYSQVKR
jgi:ATP-dependent protease ClpP protease subunit